MCKDLLSDPISNFVASRAIIVFQSIIWDIVPLQHGCRPRVHKCRRYLATEGRYFVAVHVIPRPRGFAVVNGLGFINVAYRTPEIVLHFHSEIVLTTDCIWLWAENLRTRNIFVEHVDDLYSASFPNRPPLNIEQVKAHEVEAVHKEYTVEQKLNESNQPKNFFMMRRDRRLKKNHSKISCRLCNTLVSIYDLEKHAETCVEVEDIDAHSRRLARNPYSDRVSVTQ